MLAVRPVVEQPPRERVCVDDAADAVLVLVLGDRQAGVAGADAAPQRGLDVVGDIDGDDRRDRRHHLAGLLLVQVEDAGEHRRLVRFEHAALLDSRIRRLSSSGEPPRAIRRVGIDAEHTEHRVGGGAEHDDERVEEDAEPLQRRATTAARRVSARSIA